MANQNPTDRGSTDAATPAAEDAMVEAAVLVFVLIEHPAHPTVSELSRALNCDPGDFSSVDALERAVRELVAGGLLHRQGDLILPTRAALYFDRLETD